MWVVLKDVKLLINNLQSLIILSWSKQFDHKDPCLVGIKGIQFIQAIGLMEYPKWIQHDVQYR